MKAGITIRLKRGKLTTEKFTEEDSAHLWQPMKIVL